MFSQTMPNGISTYTRKGGEMSKRLEKQQKVSCNAGAIHEILVEQEKKKIWIPGLTTNSMVGSL